jgi:hypothetical protein
MASPLCRNMALYATPPRGYLRDSMLKLNLVFDSARGIALLCAALHLPVHIASCLPWDGIKRGSLVFIETAVASKADDTLLPIWGISSAALTRRRSCWLHRDSAHSTCVCHGLLLWCVPGAWHLQQRRGDCMLLVVKFDAGGSTRQMRTHWQPLPSTTDEDAPLLQQAC